ncbi:MAG: DUF4198 domain-containing protein [Acidobacteriota bacterium]|nr:DUF4198 domain-containing protein [Acidobacteriota bacterium]
MLTKILYLEKAMKSLLAFVLLAFPLVASAHDFWIEPSTFRPLRSSAVTLRLRVGEHYSGDPVPRKPASDFVRFEAHTANGIVPVTGAVGDDPAGRIPIAADGLVMIAYQNKPAYVELTDDKLRQYLREEGLERIHELRARSPYARQPWREIYSRCAKSLLWTGTGPASLFNKRIGMPLELIPEKNPYTLRSKSSLPLQLLYLGKPLPGALIVAVPKANPKHAVSARSDAHGRVHLELDSSGAWMIKAVHMVSAPAGARGQWESLWASLTFELPR